MNESDLENIEYVLSMHPAEVSDWVVNMRSETEMLYALSIIGCAHWQLIDEAVVDAEDCVLAKKVLLEISNKNA